MYEEFQRHITGDILEIGSGIGTYSKMIVKDFPNSNIVLSDISEEYISELKQRFNLPNVKVMPLDLNNESHFMKIGKDKFDTVIGLNVIEHVKDDGKALNFIYDSLRKRGKALILVPAHQFLFNSIDRKVGHYRRYSTKSFKELVASTRFEIDDLYYYNASGILGWYLSGNILNKEDANGEAYSMYDKMIPMIRVVEKLLFRKIGISIIGILSKT
jgi:SAM-dependent methyltransferase